MPNPFKNLLLKNIELKILAIISALTLWFFVVGIENTVTKFPDMLEVQALNAPSDLTLISDLGTVRLRLRAKPDEVQNISKTDFDVTVNLQNLKAGEQEVPIQAISKKSEVSIVKVEPATIKVILEEKAEKEMKVKATVKGNAQKGYTVKDIKLTPESIKITGGKSVLAKISSMVAYINLDGSESTNFQSNVILGVEDNPQLTKMITIEPAQVAADVSISAEFQQKTVVIKPVLKGFLDLNTENRKLEINPTNVIIQGKAEVINQIDNLETEPIDLEALTKANAPIQSKLVLPKGITLLENQPASVAVSLKTQPSTNTQSGSTITPAAPTP